jgi:Helix-turn-helix domain
MPDDPRVPGPDNPDPKKLRALAHPLRWQLMDLVASEGTVTATRCAEVLGESVASCSYHLGILAKYDYIEEVPDRSGREKPWRLTGTEQDLGGTGLDTEGQLAAEAATEAFLDHEFARTKRRLRRRSLEPEQWRAKILGETTWLTEEEYAAVWRELDAVLERYRRDQCLRDPSLRPEGSREARLIIATSVAPPPHVPRHAPQPAPPQHAPKPVPKED